MRSVLSSMGKPPRSQVDNRPMLDNLAAMSRPGRPAQHTTSVFARWMAGNGLHGRASSGGARPLDQPREGFSRRHVLTWPAAAPSPIARCCWPWPRSRSGCSPIGRQLGAVGPNGSACASNERRAGQRFGPRPKLGDFFVARWGRFFGAIGGRRRCGVRESVRELSESCGGWIARRSPRPQFFVPVFLRPVFFSEARGLPWGGQ